MTLMQRPLRWVGHLEASWSCPSLRVFSTHFHLRRTAEADRHPRVSSTLPLPVTLASNCSALRRGLLLSPLITRFAVPNATLVGAVIVLAGDLDRGIYARGTALTPGFGHRAAHKRHLMSNCHVDRPAVLPRCGYTLRCVLAGAPACWSRAWQPRPLPRHGDGDADARLVPGGTALRRSVGSANRGVRRYSRDPASRNAGRRPGEKAASADLSSAQRAGSASLFLAILALPSPLGWALIAGGVLQPPCCSVVFPAPASPTMEPTR